MSSTTRTLRAVLLGATLIAVGAAAGAYAQAGKPPVVSGPPNFGAAGGGAAPAPAPAATPPPAAATATPVTPSQLAAAAAVIAATQSTKGIEQVLPSVAQQVQSVMTRDRPDLANQISDAIDTTAIKLISRRADLDNDIARIWIKYFTEDELKTIATFYRSAAGTKLSSNGPAVNAESTQAVQSWSSRLGSEMLDATKAELKRRGIDF